MMLLRTGCANAAVGARLSFAFTSRSTAVKAFSTAAAPASGDTTTHGNVQDYYGKVLKNTNDLKTSACTTSSAPSTIIQKALKKVPSQVIEKYYGCGSPLPTGIEGLSVLDLGSGSGRDCYVASQLVGKNGFVTGIDMTDEQLGVAREHNEHYCKDVLQYPESNMRFVKGYIEYLKDAGIEDESMHLAISNCVVNLSPDKEKVLQGVYDSLKVGGEFYFSDVYCDRRLSQEAKDNKVLWGECVSGALYIEDFIRLCRKVGFTDPRVLATDPVVVEDPELKDIVGEAKFYSITYRCFKIPESIETLCEDYGQVAYYKGTIPGHKHTYMLDDHHIFEKNKPMLVCGNTASMVGESYLSNHFTIVGDRSVHYGLFDCGPTPSASTAAVKASGSPDLEAVLGGGCC